MLEVNDYVRINMDNRNCIGIGRVSRIVNETIYVNMNNKYNLPVPFQIDKVVKHSKQLIDLIEVGDYVNGYKVDYVTGHYFSVESSDKFDLCFEEQDIKTILTKEQYITNCYKVGGEDETN